MRYIVSEAAVIEPLFREALPLATEEEIVELVARCAGRPTDRGNEDLMRPFGTRDTPRSRLDRIEMLVGCLVTGRRNGWLVGHVSYTIKSLMKRAAGRTAPAQPTAGAEI